MAGKKRWQIQRTAASTSVVGSPQDVLRERVKSRAEFHRVSAAQGVKFRQVFHWLATHRPDLARAWPAEYARRYEAIAAACEYAMNAAKRDLPANLEDATKEQLGAAFRSIVEFDIARHVAEHARKVDERLRQCPHVDAATLEAALVAIDDTMRKISFSMRDRINNPLFPGHNNAMLFDLSGLVAENTAMYGDFSEALAEMCSTKYDALPVAVLEVVNDPEPRQTFERFRNRAEYAVVRDGGIRKVAHQETVENDAGQLVTRSRKVRREVSVSSLPTDPQRRGDGEGVSGVIDELLRRAKKLPPQSDGFSAHVNDRLELIECFEQAKPTGRQTDMLVRKAVFGDSSKVVAADYGTTPESVDATVSQTRSKLKRTRDSIRHPEKPLRDLT